MNFSVLEKYLEKELATKKINDYCPNGLQVQGNKEIQNIVTGVTASKKLIEAAIKINADTIIVHHGFFWKNEIQNIVGMKYDRISLLIKNNINLFAYHLPLDVHPIHGNNVQLAKLLNLDVIVSFDTDSDPNYGILTNNNNEIDFLSFVKIVANKLERQPTIVQGNSKNIKKIAICTGGAQDYIEHAYRAGADTYISGEISEKTTHIARELGINYIAAGHHATERYGIKALGEHIAGKFNCNHTFIDIDNPA